jgi:hypothetical protein
VSEKKLIFFFTPLAGQIWLPPWLSSRKPECIGWWDWSQVVIFPDQMTFRPGLWLPIFPICKQFYLTIFRKVILSPEK